MPIWPKDSLFFLHPPIFGISIDSRSVMPGDAFFAFGRGHDYVLEAMSKGAACAIVERHVCDGNVVVDSVFETLQKIALLRRDMLSAQVVGITGSVGKTTSKLALAFCLQKAGRRVFASPKSYNNLLGVSLTLAQVPLDTEFLIMELGTDNFGEIACLSQFIGLDYSWLTHIAPAHIANFKTYRNILFEKADIIKFTKKCAVFNAGQWYSNVLERVARDSGVVFLKFDGAADSMDTLKCGLNSMLAALDVSVVLDIDEFLLQVPGRRRVFFSKPYNANVRVIDSAYNANLASMIDSIKFLQMQMGKKVAILSQMLAIGKHSDRFHEILSCYLNDVRLLLVGSAMKYLLAKRPDALYFDSVDELLLYVEYNINFDCSVLIKGSLNVLAPVVDYFERL